MVELLTGDFIALMRTLPDRSVDCILTDPPYGDNTSYGRAGRTIAGNANPLTCLLALAEGYRVLKTNRTAYVFLGTVHLPIVDQFVRRYTGFKIRDWLVWDKQLIGMGYGFRKRHEMIAVLEKGRPQYNGSNVPTVLTERRVRTSEHPHKKPVDLLSRLIELSARRGDSFLDPFLGSGSTGVAAQMLGRRFIGIDIDPRCVKIARQRIAALG